MSSLPGRPQDLAEQLARPEEDLVTELHDLYVRGLVFIAEATEGGPTYELVDAGRLKASDDHRYSADHNKMAAARIARAPARA